MNINTVKGFNDYIGPLAQKRTKIVDIIRSNFEAFGFTPAQTPIIESYDFVKGEDSSDEAVRDVFKLEDRGKRKLALRYEFTFQLKRLAKNQKLPYKRYQIGPNFRDEPIRQGRTREFTQCDADVIGSGVRDEAEILALGKKIFDELKINTTIQINNRKLTNEIFEDLKIKEKDRKQVMRELDKLDKLPSEKVAKNLEKYGAQRLVKVFTEKEKYFEKYANYKKITELKELCSNYGLKVKFKPSLARGFSYYDGSVFEIWAKDLNVSLVGGGSYKINKITSTGISFGLEPISLVTKIEADNDTIQLTSIDQYEKAINLAQELRKNKIKVNLITDKTIPKALEYANSKNIKKMIILGKKEIEAGKIKIKDMDSGKESLISESELIKSLFTPNN